MSSWHETGYRDGKAGVFKPPGFPELDASYMRGYREAVPPFVDVWWIDENDGAGHRKLSRAIRCF